ncbi:MAG: type VI secretion system lipoprotein TssJ [Gammaproteobacteria bacterium]
MILSMIILLLGCGSPKVKVNVAADQSINQDNQQRSLPVVMRVYQLSSKTKFEHADFKQLWKQDMELLGTELLSREEYLIHPGELSTLKVTKQDNVQYIGVVALFRDNVQNHWRLLKPVSQSGLAPHFSNSMAVNVKDKTIKIAS